MGRPNRPRSRRKPQSPPAMVGSPPETTMPSSQSRRRSMKCSASDAKMVGRVSGRQARSALWQVGQPRLQPERKSTVVDRPGQSHRLKGWIPRSLSQASEGVWRIASRRFAAEAARLHQFLGQVADVTSFSGNAGCASMYGHGIRYACFVAGRMRCRAVIASAAVRFVSPGEIATRRNYMVQAVRALRMTAMRDLWSNTARATFCTDPRRDSMASSFHSRGMPVRAWFRHGTCLFSTSRYCLECIVLRPCQARVWKNIFLRGGCGQRWKPRGIAAFSNPARFFSCALRLLH